MNIEDDVPKPLLAAFSPSARFAIRLDLDQDGMELGVFQISSWRPPLTSRYFTSRRRRRSRIRPSSHFITDSPSLIGTMRYGR